MSSDIPSDANARTTAAPFAGAPSPEAQQVAATFTSHKRAAGTPSVEERRQEIEALALVYPVPADVVTEETAVGGVPALRLVPRGADRASTIVYLHGGGYTRGSARSFAHLAARLASAAGTTATVVDYRLAPEHPFPAAFDDAVAACREVLGHFDPTRVALAGDSAGGGVAMAASVALRDGGPDLPACCVLFSPWVDLREGALTPEAFARDALLSAHDFTVSAGSYLAGGADPADPRVSPVLADLSALSPTQVFVGGAEALGPQIHALARRAQDAGTATELIEVAGLFHDWPIFADLPESLDAVHVAAAFIRNHLRLV